MAKRKSLLGADARKIHPKLRMIAGGSARVNAIRAGRCGSIGVTPDAPKPSGALVTGSTDIPIPAKQMRESKGKLHSLAEEIEANVFVQTNDLTDPRRTPFPIEKGNYAGKGNLLTARVKLSDLPALASHQSVTHIELGEPLRAPSPIVANRSPAEPSKARWRFGRAKTNGRRRGNPAVLIGIIDVQGFDFAHPDFLARGGGTRWVSIWDQGGAARLSPKARNEFDCPFDYGAEFLKADLDAAIRAERKLKIPAYEIERQSQISEGSHGTHVASIAAGNRGVCRNAAIAGVLISLPAEDQDRRKTFYDSTCVAHAVEYLLAVAAKLELPLSINISLGTNGHAHDASNAISRWIDSALAIPGRSITIAAGNAGQEIAQFEGDRGYVMGRIHTSGHVPARGLDRDIEWLVVGNGVSDVSENEFEIWYGAQDRFAVSVLPPGPGARWVGPINPGQFVENEQVARDHSLISIYNELYHPANGANYIGIYLSPFFGNSGVAGIQEGRWTVRLHGLEVRDGHYHGWIERDDPRQLGRSANQELWSFPSYFSEKSNVDDSSVGSMACGRWIISVANYDERDGRIHTTSSQGPTRDGRCKPEVAAPGTSIVAAKGFASRKDLWIAMTGTSMASPFAAGVAGLMLEENRKLTAAQIAGIMQRTSRPLPGASYAWANDAGFGVLDAAACLREAVTVTERDEIRPRNRRKKH